MSSIKYIYDEQSKTLETETGDLFIDNNANIAIFDSITQVYQYLKENQLEPAVGRRVNMNINNSI
jgi:hypothetical protein